MIKRGKFIFKETWYSICSMHQEYNDNCNMCNKGSWYNNILHNITNSNFDISLLNYEIDRFILKSINSNNTNKYLLLNRG